MKTLVTALLVAALTAGCGASTAHDSGSMVTLAPDDFVLRDVRTDAARHLNCQAPMVRVELGPWAGSSGNVIATGCGFHITYYLSCETSHLCQFTVAE